MANPPPLAYGATYHICSRGVGGENLFREERNTSYFLELYAHYIEPVAATYAYCLLRNHFHVFVRTYTVDEQRERVGGVLPATWRPLSPSRRFALLFGTYAQAYNKAYGRSGSLFEHPFRRVRVEREAHFAWLAVYIHRNPQHHGLVEDFATWRHSSYRAHLSSGPTRLRRDDVLAWYGGREGFVEAHRVDQEVDDAALRVE